MCLNLARWADNKQDGNYVVGKFSVGKLGFDLASRQVDLVQANLADSRQSGGFD